MDMDDAGAQGWWWAVGGGWGWGGERAAGRWKTSTKQETRSNSAAGGNGATADGARQLEADGGMKGRRDERGRGE